jgi:hypothetical protein
MIFHIFGAQLSGKTTVVKQLNPEEFAHWDILEDFYTPRKIIENNKIDWTKWEFNEKYIEPELKKFIEENKHKHIIIESSGLNKTINKTLKLYRPITAIRLKSPTIEEAISRAKERGLSVSQVLTFMAKLEAKFDNLTEYLPNSITPNEAVEFIQTQTKNKRGTNEKFV